MNDEMAALINTLMQNNLAGSVEDATRMAESMLGTAKKVSKPFEENDEHFMIKGYKKGNNDVLSGGTSDDEKGHPASYPELEKDVNQMVREHQAEHIQKTRDSLVQERKPSPKLSLDNPSSFTAEPKPISPAQDGKLSLDNTFVVSERKPVQEEKPIEQIPGAKEVLSMNATNLDPVTSAPRGERQSASQDSEEQKVDALQGSGAQGSVGGEQILVSQASVHEEQIQQVPVQPVSTSSAPASSESVQQAPVQQAPLQETRSDMTPEEYAAKQLSGSVSLNDLMEREKQNVQAIPEPSTESVVSQTEEKKGPVKLSLDNPSTMNKQQSASQGSDEQLGQQNSASGVQQNLANSEQQPVTSPQPSALSLDNPVMQTERSKEEKPEGVLALGLPDTSAITNMDLDPVTSAPREKIIQNSSSQNSSFQDLTSQKSVPRQQAFSPGEPRDEESSFHSVDDLVPPLDEKPEIETKTEQSEPEPLEARAHPQPINVSYNSPSVNGLDDGLNVSAPGVYINRSAEEHAREEEKLRKIQEDMQRLQEEKERLEQERMKRTAMQQQVSEQHVSEQQVQSSLAPEQPVQPQVLPQQQAPVQQQVQSSPHIQQQSVPVAENTSRSEEVIEEKTRQIVDEKPKKKVGFTPEEEKLRQQVDLSKVFNMGK